MTRQLDMSGFKELFVMHIPRANLPLTSTMLETSWRDSEGVKDVMVNDGSMTSRLLVNS